MVLVDASNLASCGVEEDRCPGGHACLDEVLDHFLLAVDNDAPARQLLEINPVALTVESQMNTSVLETFAIEPFTDARVLQELRRALFEAACAHSSLDVLAAATLDHDRIDACTM